MPPKPRLDRGLNLRLSDEVYNALRLEAEENDATISETARSLLTVALVRQHPTLLAHLVDDDGVDLVVNVDGRLELDPASRDEHPPGTTGEPSE